MSAPYSIVNQYYETLVQLHANASLVAAISVSEAKSVGEQAAPSVEIRFLPGRLKFGGCKDAAPFPSMVVVFRP